MKRGICILLTSILFLLFTLSLFGCKNQGSVDDQDPVDYSQMSKEEIITEFMKAWEADDIAVMDELSDFPDSMLEGMNFKDNGYHPLFSWGNVSMGNNPTCNHGYETFSHAVYDLKIRQSDNTDYGYAPDENWKEIFSNYENVYDVDFSMDENSIIRHLEVCIFGGQEGKLTSDDAFERDGKYECSQYFILNFDEEKGHWVIVDKKYAL